MDEITEWLDVCVCVCVCECIRYVCGRGVSRPMGTEEQRDCWGFRPSLLKLLPQHDCGGFSPGKVFSFRQRRSDSNSTTDNTSPAHRPLLTTDIKNTVTNDLNSVSRVWVSLCLCLVNVLVCMCVCVCVCVCVFV